MTTSVDIVIIGAGPAGLCLAKALEETNLRITIFDKQTEANLADPAFDGREIALTHSSVQLMLALNILERIDQAQISPLMDARIFNGSSLLSLNINHRDAKQNELGYLIPNNLIRKAAYEAVKSSSAISLRSEVQITSIKTMVDCVQLTLADGAVISTKLLVGADSRYSETRRAAGIATDIHDFGKTMLVCVMEHPVSHDNTAWEWFDYGQTLALLPMNGMQSSVVITLPPDEINHLMTMQENDFNSQVSARFKHRLGQMKLVSTRHAYPLVTVYARRLVASRFALIGDAAVGMHPVTAHGFNFGLKSIASLSANIKAALESGTDIASNKVLLAYERTHRRQTRPLFLATHAIANIYSNDSLPARFLRATTLRLGRRIPSLKRAVAEFLG